MRRVNLRDVIRVVRIPNHFFSDAVLPDNVWITADGKTAEVVICALRLEFRPQEQQKAAKAKEEQGLPPLRALAA